MLINIVVIKYWGKRDETLILRIYYCINATFDSNHSETLESHHERLCVRMHASGGERAWPEETSAARFERTKREKG